ncbi:MAG: type II toxin-antitoxin system RelB/DinJ family antitoxin [Sedimentisphaerales bacterium]|nr:type II toxin-antitoxin system RelB/DinJ family antitoxin [Sedimentisphaerales bacterium]
MDATTIQVRLDKKTKSQAQKVFKVLDISMSEAIKLFLRQVALQKGIPFEIKIPNALTDRVLRESEEGIDLHKVSNVDQLFEELET